MASILSQKRAEGPLYPPLPAKLPLHSKVYYDLHVPRSDMATAFQVMLTILDRFQKAGSFHFSESAELWKAIQVMNSGIAQLPDVAVEM
jgi:hypothetical protein